MIHMQIIKPMKLEHPLEDVHKQKAVRLVVDGSQLKVKERTLTKEEAV